VLKIFDYAWAPNRRWALCIAQRAQFIAKPLCPIPCQPIQWPHRFVSLSRLQCYYVHATGHAA